MIGLLGGSFDPIHAAHLAMADAFAAALSLDEVRFLPAARPWQKNGLAASADQRLQMIERALAGHPAPRGRYTIDAREIERPGDTFTVDTLADVRREIGPAEPLVFLFGADQLLHLDSWHRWTALWEPAHLAAVTRPGFGTTTLPPAVARVWTSRLGGVADLHGAPGGRSFLLETLSLAVSATDIRAALADHASDAEIDRLVPPAVLDYIRANHLYRS